MFKYLVAALMVVGISGCSSDRQARVEGYVKGCSEMAHGLIDPQGGVIDDAKLTEFCKAAADASLNNKK